MKDQHTKITGYRDLSQDEIDLMNQIKNLGSQLQGVIDHVNAHLAKQKAGAKDEESARIDAAQPARWAAMAKTDLQTGLMNLTRAVAQPTSF